MEHLPSALVNFLVVAVNQCSSQDRLLQWITEKSVGNKKVYIILDKRGEANMIPPVRQQRSPFANKPFFKSKSVFCLKDGKDPRRLDNNDF